MKPGTYALNISASLSSRPDNPNPTPGAWRRDGYESIQIFVSGEIEVGSLIDAEVLLAKLKDFIASYQRPETQKP